MTVPSEDITQMLMAWSRGDPAALDRLMPVVYGELRRLAEHHLRRERPGHTLQPTALVHEAYLRLVRPPEVGWQGRAHFFGLAARAMREIVIDHARRHQAQKREAGRRPVALEEVLEWSADRAADLVALDDALRSLARLDPEKSRLVELRFFGGLSMEEIAEVMGWSPRTVYREWRTARAWLQSQVIKMK